MTVWRRVEKNGIPDDMPFYMVWVAEPAGTQRLIEEKYTYVRC